MSQVEVGNPAAPAVTEAVDFLSDSGAIYSCRAGRDPEAAGDSSARRRDVPARDGSTITRGKGIALVRSRDRVGGADVIFGEPDDAVLLGALTLEALGLALDPLRRALKPLPLRLAGSTRES